MKLFLTWLSHSLLKFWATVRLWLNPTGGLEKSGGGGGTPSNHMTQFSFMLIYFLKWHLMFSHSLILRLSKAGEKCYWVTRTHTKALLDYPHSNACRKSGYLTLNKALHWAKHSIYAIPWAIKYLSELVNTPQYVAGVYIGGLQVARAWDYIWTNISH